MPLRYLFGPVTGTFADQSLHAQRRSGLVRAFGPDEGVDVRVRPGDAWEEVRRQFPDGWAPDFLALHLAYELVPACFWQSPLPKVGLANGWHFLWHYYRNRLRQCDLVLANDQGAERLGRVGIAAQCANLCGCARLFVGRQGLALDAAPADGLRDIDVLFVGNLNPAVQRQRAPWLTRLARLGRRWRVQIRTGVFGDELRRLLLRTRIVVQFSARGKLGRRAFEAAGCGALIFQEAGNRELPTYFRDQREAVYYTPESLEELLALYLDHEEERQALAQAAAERARSGGYEDLWQDCVDAIEKDWPDLRNRAGRRILWDATEELTTRCWQALTCGGAEDLTLLADLDRTLQAAPEAALLANLAGCMLWRQGRGRNPPSVVGAVAAGYFRRALAAQPDFVLAGLNLAESLASAGRLPEAIPTARQTLERLERAGELDSASRDGMPLCQSFDTFHVEWERAAWRAAGSAEMEARGKRELILWKLHSLLGAWTGELTHDYEAAVRRPDLPLSRAALGNALLRANRHLDALDHLREALDHNPLDRDLARTCYQLIGTVKDDDARRRLVGDRRLLAQAMPHVIPHEAWFAEPRLKGDELTSVVIACEGTLDRLQRCVESVLRHTRTPYELLLVCGTGNAGVREYLDGVRRRRGPARVDAVRAADDAGFAADCNRALGRARGAWVVLLDAGTVVTPGWLECLIAAALHDWPHVGMVGPVTNDAPVPQSIVKPMPTATALDDFAAQHRQSWRGQTLAVGRLSHAGLLARHAVFQQLGPADASLVEPALVVADWCLRARERGLRLVVARDAFLAHAADATPADDSGMARLKEKWGPELVAPWQPAVQVPEALPEHTGRAPTQSSAEPVNGAPDGPPKHGVSLCMIVKNEADHLPACLRTVHGLFDETVVVDTGSSDGTADAARRLGARVFEFPWVDSFGAARNESLRHATGKWIMWLDADDRLDDENRERLRKVLTGLRDERDAYAVTVRSALDREGGVHRLLDQVRIFRNLPEVRWDYRIHEQILPAVNRVGGGVRWTDVIVDHVGYQDASVRQRKLERNLRLLEMDDAERPDDSFSLFNLGWTLLDLGRTNDAFPRLKRSLDNAKPDSSILRKLYHLLAVAQLQLGAAEQALKACRDGLARFPDDAELLLEQGLMLRDRGDLAGAELSWLRLLEPKLGQYFSSEDVGLRGFRTRQLLAELFFRQERWPEAEVQWRAALEERRDFEPAWLGLADLYVQQARWAELDDLLDRLDAQGCPPPKVAWLRARGFVQRGEFTAARQLLTAVIAQDPQALGPRVLLTQALLQEGRDWHAAEQALLDVLALEPGNADATHNLEVLRRQHHQSVRT